MSAGITIIPGSFPPGVPPGDAPQNFRLPVRTAGNVEYGYDDLASGAFLTPASGAGEEEPPQVDDFDYSAMVVPPADLWVANVDAGELWSGRRRIRMAVDWENLPSNAASVRVYDDESGAIVTAVEAGAATFLTRLDFQVRTYGLNIPFSDTPVLESEFLPYLHGQDYTSSGGTIHANIALTGREGYNSPEDDISFARTIAPLCTVSVKDSGGVTLKSWLFRPFFTTTNRMRSGASANPAIEDSTRNIRVSYNGETGVWTLKTPEGFEVP